MRSIMACRRVAMQSSLRRLAPHGHALARSTRPGGARPGIVHDAALRGYGTLPRAPAGSGERVIHGLIAANCAVFGLWHSPVVSQDLCVRACAKPTARLL